jgi:hypothetical protein
MSKIIAHLVGHAGVIGHSELPELPDGQNSIEVCQEPQKAADEADALPSTASMRHPGCDGLVDEPALAEPLQPKGCSE